MKIPLHDRKFQFLLAAIIIVIGLEVLSLLGLHIPEPYAPFCLRRLHFDYRL